MARRISSEELFERESARTTLWAAVERARAGMPTVTVVMGEAGIGKTRLVCEVGERARAEGALVLVGECVELDGGELPYAPIAACLRDLPPEQASEVRGALSHRARVELARALPGLRWDDGEGYETAALDRFSQARLFEFLLALLRELSRGPPVLMVIEDMHWADRSTLDFIAFLVHNLRAERLAVAVTYREDELGGGHRVRRMVAEMVRSERVDCLRLQPLSAEAVAAQVDAIVGERVSSELRTETFLRSGGNPFLVEELLAAWIAGLGPEDLPSTLKDALLTRVERMGSGTRPVLRAAAAIGRPAPTALLATVARMDVVDVSDALRTAMRHHMLVQFSGDRFGFRHGLVREVVYDDLLPTERRELHERVAEALSVDGSGEAWGEIAFHWRAAARRAEALGASVRAALQAEEARAYGEAWEHLERALELLEGPGGAPEDLPLSPHAMLERAARLARYCGDYRRAIELCDTALAALDASAEPVRAAELYELRGRCQSYEHDCGLACFRQALALLPEGNDARRARLLGAEGFALVALHCWPEARERCEAAVALAERAGARDAEVYARARLGLALAVVGEADTGERQLLWACESAERLGLAEDLLYSHVYLGEVRRLRGRFEAAYEAMADGQRAATRLGMQASFGRFMALNAAADLLTLGRWDEALAMLDDTEGRDLEPWQELMHRQVAGQLAVARGDAVQARRYLQRGRELCEEGAPPDYLPPVFAALAEQALWHGEHAEARAVVSDALERVAGDADLLNTPVLYSMGARACADAAEQAAAVGADGEAAGARSQAERMLRALERLLTDADGAARWPSALAHQALCRAEVARANGAPAIEEWREAAAAWRSLEVPYCAAYAQWRLAEALLSGKGGRDEATRVLRRALAEAERLGAVPLRVELEGLAQRARLSLPDDAADAGFDAAPKVERGSGRPLGLTARELEVLELIAEGLTNRQISQRLFISEKTAGVHVSHILGKLNAPNRVAAAGVAHRLGLLSPRSSR